MTSEEQLKNTLKNRKATCSKFLSRIEGHLRLLADDKTADWGNAGSLEHIETLLAQALHFAGGMTEAEQEIYKL